MAIRDLLKRTDFFSEPMALVFSDGTIDTPNQSFAEQFGLRPEDLAGRRLDTLTAATAIAIQEYLRACSESVKAVHESLLLQRRAETVVLLARGVAYPPSSAPTASHVLLSLVTESRPEASSAGASREQGAGNWRDIEQSLRRQSEILEVTLASIGDAIIVTDAQGRVTFMNAVATSLTGWLPEQAKGRPLTQIFPIINEYTRQPVQDPVAKVLQTGTIAGLANHSVLTSRDGREIPIGDSAAPIRMPDGTLFGVVLVFRDLSEQRQADHARSWLAAIVDFSNDAIVSKTLDGQITSWNPAASRLFGHTAEEIIGKPITTIIPVELHAQEAEVLSRLRRGERVENFETVRLTKDGKRIEVSLTVSPIRDQYGAIIGASKIARDVTERRRAERMLLEADRRKDEFLATLAHELRHPLAPIANSVEVLCRIGSDQPQFKAACGIIERQLRQMTRLVDDLLDSSRISTGRIDLQLAPVELTQLLRVLEGSMRPAFDALRQQFTLISPAEPVYVHGDSGRLLQVFANVLENANKYTPAGGAVSMELERDAGEVVIRVRDTGIGIPPDMLREIFQPFAQVDSSHPRTRGGLGLGLSVAKRLIELHGGQLQAHSAGEGKGSEFVIRMTERQAPDHTQGPV